MSVGKFSDLFEVPSNIAYFNTAYNSPLLTASRTALQAAASFKSRPWERSASSFFDDAESMRTICASLFASEMDNFAIVPAASYAISTASRIVEPMLGPGDRIMLLDQEFPSNVLPWRRVAAETGAEIVTVERPVDGDWTKAVLDRLSGDIRVASLSACHWTDGAALDLARIGRACRGLDIILSLDVTQSLGAVPLDLAAVRPDFMVAAGYKWLLCPYGASIFYVDPRWHDARPLEEGWLARADSQNFAGLVHYRDEYRAGARRFDVGETCVTTVLPGAIAALAQLDRWTVPFVAAQLGEITARIEADAASFGYEVLAPQHRSPHMLGLRARKPQELIEKLRAAGVCVSQRGEAVRIAPHLHVTPDNIAALLDALRAAA